MKLIATFCFILFIINLLHAQNPNKGNLWNGVGDFIIGTDRSVFDGGLKLINGGSDTSGVKKSYGYEYLPAAERPVNLAGVKFSKVWLFFNEKYKLAGISLFATYKESDSLNYLQQAEEGGYQLVLLLKKSLKMKGEEKYRHLATNGSTIQYSWKKKYREVMFSTVQGKIPGKGFVNLVIDFGITQD